MKNNINEQTVQQAKGRPMLQWTGKRPLQRVDYYPAQEKEVYGNKSSSWFNRIYWGDNLQVLSHLLKEFRGKVDLIYIDPPFDSKADYIKRVKLRGQKIEGRQQSILEEKQYTDIWENDDYLQFMYDRLLIMRELLADTGSIYLHYDWHKSAYIRLIMDEVFGIDNFCNEIIWTYGAGGNPRNFFPRKHDSILFYSKTDKNTFNVDRAIMKVPYDESTLSTHYKNVDESGRRYRTQTVNGKQYTTFADEGKLVTDVWTDIGAQNATSPISNETTGYPTQKPEKLLERIIEASSNPGDLVLDCFMGSGTTQVVAQQLGRRWIGCDINTGAIQTAVKRLNQALEEKANTNPLIPNDFDTYGFKVLNVNEYDIFKNEVEAKELVMEAYGIEPAPIGGFDGLLDGSFVTVMPLNRVFNKIDAKDIVEKVRHALDLFTVKTTSQTTESTYQERVIVVCSGSELDIDAFLKQENTTGVQIEVRDIQQDKKHLTFKSKPEVEVSIDIVGETQTVRLVDYFSPMLMQRLHSENEHTATETSQVVVEDFRQLIDAVAIDIDYDGKLFNPEVIDVPAKNDLIANKYQIPCKTGKKQAIAIKVTDVLGDETFMVREVGT